MMTTLRTTDREQVFSILWLLPIGTQQDVSLERIFGYTKIEQEPKPTKEGTPPAYWPSSGTLEVENLSARYSADGPKVLEGVSFKLESGQRIGVGEHFVLSCVGRLINYTHLYSRPHRIREGE
jgi:ABC-type multidrug transport system fused ATPase/permease subunit